MIVKGLIFVAGVATGLYIAKLYARSKVEGTLESLIDKIPGVGSDTAASIAHTFAPLVA